MYTVDQRRHVAGIVLAMRGNRKHKLLPKLLRLPFTPKENTQKASRVPMLGGNPAQTHKRKSDSLSKLIHNVVNAFFLLFLLSWAVISMIHQPFSTISRILTIKLPGYVRTSSGVGTPFFGSRHRSTTLSMICLSKSSLIITAPPASGFRNASDSLKSCFAVGLSSGSLCRQRRRVPLRKLARSRHQYHVPGTRLRL